MNRAVFGRAVLVSLLLGLFAPANAAPAAPAAPQTPAPRAASPVPNLRAVVVVGAKSVSADTIARAADVSLGKPANAETIRAAADAVVAEYRRRGFLVAQVVATDLDADGTLRLTVAEGTVRRILIRGNGKTRTRTILDAMRTHPGDVYREDRIADDRDRLARLGIFEDVVVGPEIAGEPGEQGEGEATAASEKPAPPAIRPAGAAEDTVGLVDVVVRVKERRTGNLAATLGFGDSTGLIGYVELREANFAGRAQRVEVEWQRWNRTRFENDGTIVEEKARAAYRTAFFSPMLGRSRTAFGLEVYDKNTIFQPLFAGDDETIRSYERRRGGTVRVGRAVANGLSLFVSARRDVVGYDAVPLNLNPPLDALADADATVGALGLKLIADGRDAAENPRRGHLWSLSYEHAGSILGGNRNFGQTIVDARQYAPLGGGSRGVVLALRVLGGTSSGDIPLSEQFWLGGYELLRGYDLYSIRGDRMLLASAEARLPLAEGLQGALFVDWGNAWEPGERVSLSDLRSGVGLGLRFLSPIGPIRLDAAYGSGLKTYVSLGQAY